MKSHSQNVVSAAVVRQNGGKYEGKRFKQLNDRSV